MAYTKLNWKNSPDTSTPLSAANLNHLETQYDEAKSYTDSAVAPKANKSYVDSQGFVVGTPSVSTRLVAGSARRVDGTTWEFIRDSGHEPIGVSTVEIVGANRLRINYGFTASKVGSFVVALDESFAGINNVLKVGASVGLTYADVYFYLGATSTTPVDPGTLSTAGANIWFYGVMLA